MRYVLDKTNTVLIVVFITITIIIPLMNTTAVYNQETEQETADKHVNVSYPDKYLPINLSVASTGSNSSHIFIFGGTNDSWVGTDGIFLLDTQTLTCTRIGSLPEPAYGMGSVQIDSRVYLIGGFCGGVGIGSSLDQILCYNIDTLSFEQIDSILPRGLERPNVAEIDGKINIFFGSTFNVGTSDNIYVFDPLIDTIETLDFIIPVKLAGASIHWTGSELLFYGGYNIDTSEIEDRIWVFNPNTVSFQEREEKLPFPSMYITELVAIDNLLYTSSLYNSSGHYNNDIYEINLDTFDFKLIQEDYLSSERSNYITIKDDLHVILLGGIPEYVYADNSIILVDTSKITHDTVLLEPDNQDWIISNGGNFKFENNTKRFAWQTEPSYDYMIKDHKRVTKEKDRLEVEIEYHNHSDVNTRQIVHTGWTDSVNFTPVNHGLLSTCPSKNFIGISVRNSVTKIVIFTSIVYEENYLLKKEYYLEVNVTHFIRFQVYIINRTHFEQKITIDGQIMANEIVEGNLVGMNFNSLAIWNQENSLMEIEGNYAGTLNFARYSQNLDMISSRNLLIEGLVLFIVVMLAFSVYMLVIYQTRRANQGHPKGPSEIPNQLIPSTAYKLYCSLDKAFKRLEKISGFYVVNDQPVSDVADTSGLVEEWKEKEEVSLPDFDFTQLSGTSLEIMIYLLDYLDHGTYSSVIKEDLGLKRSTVAYNIHLLENKGLIVKMNPQLEKDQRMKLICLTSIGRGLLYQIYVKLEHFYS